MAARDLLAAAPSEGGDVPAWSWYVPLVLVAVLIAALCAHAYFVRTLVPLVLALFGLTAGAVMVGVMVGEPQAMEIARARGDRGPKDFGQLLMMLVIGALIMHIAQARRRGRAGEGGGWDGEGGGWDGEGGGCDDGGD